MAWVCLSDLLAEDKNYRGLLYPDGIGKIVLSIPEETRKHLKESFLKEFDDNFKNKKIYIKDLFTKSIITFPINAPEWALRNDGFLYNFTEGLLKINGKLQFLTIFEIDIRKYLKTLDIEQLEEIAEYTFYKWERTNNDSFNTKRVPNIESIANFFHSLNLD